MFWRCSILLKRTHTCGELNSSNSGQEVILNGWVDRIRDLGGIKFIMLRDRYGKTQVFFDPNENQDLYQKALKLGNEYTVSIKGIVKERPADAINTDMKTGDIEIHATELEILSESETPPIYVNRDEEISENLRLKYRYLDLRKEKMQKNIILRHRVMQAARNYLSNKDFLEIETPFLNKSTPEGARDFVVPSRIKKGNFYALPQSPQIFKQLLMVSGMDKYFQIARCFRDEDFRADRQPEFTQIDFEASFVDKEDIFEIGEGLVKECFDKGLNVEIETPFKRMTYKEAMNKYGSDKPDTRYGMELNDITEYFKNTKAKFLKSVIDENGVIKGFSIPEKANEFSRKKFDELTDLAKQFGASGLIWISKEENKDVKSTIKKLAEEEINNLLNDGIINDGEVMLIVAGELSKVNKILGQLRATIIRDEYVKKDGFDIMWITDFPMFSWNEEEQRLEAEHHPFTMPNVEDLEMYKDEPLKINSQSYDLVINGYEMASGSVRIHRKDIQNKVFEIIGLKEEEITDKFGFLLEAFRYGPPPHAGAALGMDRLVAVMAGEDSIKEVIAFPKTATGSDPMAEAPSKLSEYQLKELNIILKND
ncbi:MULTISPECIES: aspartate--tRNA ligase [Oceanotoga]|jgi:aspartyl-tRNA synthetase|uniref:aspartate--tRNA ligase n=1 Tax=Oceanotoga TaxID=1255275 RepID=UPI00264D6E8B|nr:aspartyl-tRNA synthetase [Oceanotoga sp.]